jgi:intracellular multiplication protein IcmO
MAKPIPGLDDKFSYAPYHFLRDTRPVSQKITDSAKQPGTAGYVIIVLGVLAFALAKGAEIPFVIGMLYFAWFRAQKLSLPLKLPVQADTKDPNDSGKAQGIFYIGTDHNSQQLWINNADARTHFMILGTTGSGKTEALLSIATNALTWGSGFLYTDGKGDSTLWGKIYSLARKFGREDDVLVLNFMTGNVDGKSSSNTMNPFSHGSSSALTEMLVGLMDDPGKEGDMWKGRAIGLISAIMIALVELRDKGKLLLDIMAIQDHLNLERIIDLYLDRHGQYELSEKSKRALRGYLDSLPGFDWNEARAGRPQSGTTNDQHGYLFMQFTRIMGSLADTYGYIFGTELGDIDLYDVVVNRRILAVLLPALEKSEDELANLGKIVVASLKGMMATTLGAKIEGEWTDVIDTKPTNSPTPFLAILDEVGYYTVPGMAVMAAQARSLGFSLIFAAQDLAAMKKRSEKEADSIVANTNFKAFMKLEDPESTKEMFKKTAGSATVTEASGFSMEANQTMMNYYDMRNASIRDRSKADFVNLKGLSPGQCYLTNSGKLYRVQLFYANPPKAPQLRYNKMIPVRHPDLGALGAGAVDTVIARLSDPIFRAAEAEPARPTVGEIAAAARLMATATDMAPMRRACAAIAAVGKAIMGDKTGKPGAAAGGASRDADTVDDFSLGGLDRDLVAAQRSDPESEQDLFARLWGSVSNDVVAGIRALQEAAVGDAGDEEGAVSEVARAAGAASDYPDGPPPPRMLESAVLEAIQNFRHALAHGASEFAGSDVAWLRAPDPDRAAQTKAEQAQPRKPLPVDEEDDWEIDAAPDAGPGEPSRPKAPAGDDDDWATEDEVADE